MSKLVVPFGVVLGAFILVSLFFVLPAEPVAALSLQEGVNAARGSNMPTDLFGGSGIVTTISNFLLYIAGLLSVVMIIIGGLRYVISGGNAAAVTAAKNTILYAIVGLVVAFLAFAAVNFVLGAISPGGGGFGGFGGFGGGAGYSDV
jgi:hypothetical protein